MSDIVERLKSSPTNYGEEADLIDDATVEITRLRAENEKLRKAFERAANDMRPMLRSMISRDEAAEIVRRAAAAAIRESGDE